MDSAAENPKSKSELIADTGGSSLTISIFDTGSLISSSAGLSSELTFAFLSN